MEEASVTTAAFDVLVSPRHNNEKEDNSDKDKRLINSASPLPLESNSIEAPRGRVAYNLSDTLPTELILLRREKKIAIPIPEIDRTDPLEGNTEARRLHRVYLSTKKFLHLYNEAYGGVYGTSSRPELEIHVFEYSYCPETSTSPPTVLTLPSPPALSRPLTLIPSKATPLSSSCSPPSLSSTSILIHLNLIYDPEKNLYVLSPHMEDLLIVYLLYAQTSSTSLLPSLQSSTQRVGIHEFNTLDPFRQRQWRRFLRLYISPLLISSLDPLPSLSLPLRVQRAVDYMRDYVENPETAGYVTPEEDGDGNSSSDSDSEEGKGKKKKRKGKKKAGGGKGGNKSSTKKTGGGGGGVTKKNSSQTNTKK
jgi:hypothetical protein